MKIKSRQEANYKNFEASNFKFDDKTRSFSGYASKFGNVDAYGDTIFKGAYHDTLLSRERPVRMRWNHWGDIIGKWIDIKEDDVGLFVKGELTKGHSVADNVYASLKHGSIDGMSIGYYPVHSEKNKHGGEDLHAIELIEISIVEEPADDQATISNIKNKIESLNSIKQIEGFIRDECHLSHTAAKTLISRIKNHRDDDEIIDCSNLVLNL